MSKNTRINAVFNTTTKAFNKLLMHKFVESYYDYVICYLDTLNDGLAGANESQVSK